MPNTREPIELFFSYASEDEPLLNELEKHLSLLHRLGLITAWHSRLVVPGTDWMQTVDEHLERASVILLLISADFLASDYCYGVEMQRALQRHQNKQAQVLPILLRPVNWKGAAFGHLRALPTNEKPTTTWKNQDEAFANVAAGIRQAIEDFVLPDSIPQHSNRTILESNPGQFAQMGIRREQRGISNKPNRALWIRFGLGGALVLCIACISFFAAFLGEHGIPPIRVVAPTNTSVPTVTLKHTSVSTATPTSAVPNSAWDVILNGSYTSSKYNTFSPRITGYHYLIINLTFKNISSIPQSFSGSSFLLQDEKGQRYTVAEASKIPLTQTLTVSPGQSIEQQEIAFAVPGSSCKFDLWFVAASSISTPWSISTC